MKILVMGGTRFNGLALVHELVKYGHDVTVHWSLHFRELDGHLRRDERPADP